MFFSEKQANSKVAPESPIWKLKIKDAMAVKHLEELPSGDGFLLALHGDEEPVTAKVMKISFDGRPIWELDVPNHGELTAITVTQNGYFLSGHKADRFDGIDASISKISLNGGFLWNKSFGNPKGGDLIFSGLDEGEKSDSDKALRIQGFEREGKSFGGATAFKAKISNLMTPRLIMSVR